MKVLPHIYIRLIPFLKLAIRYLVAKSSSAKSSTGAAFTYRETPTFSGVCTWPDFRNWSRRVTLKKALPVTKSKWPIRFLIRPRLGLKKAQERTVTLENPTGPNIDLLFLHQAWPSFKISRLTKNSPHARLSLGYEKRWERLRQHWTKSVRSWYVQCLEEGFAASTWSLHYARRLQPSKRTPSSSPWNFLQDCPFPIRTCVLEVETDIQLVEEFELWTFWLIFKNKWPGGLKIWNNFFWSELLSKMHTLPQMTTQNKNNKKLPFQGFRTARGVLMFSQHWQTHPCEILPLPTGHPTPLLFNYQQHQRRLIPKVLLYSQSASDADEGSNQGQRCPVSGIFAFPELKASVQLAFICFTAMAARLFDAFTWPRATSFWRWVRNAAAETFYHFFSLCSPGTF